MMSSIYAALLAVERWCNRLEKQAKDIRDTLDQIESERAGGRS